jgi:hypothetical protein
MRLVGIALASCVALGLTGAASALADTTVGATGSTYGTSFTCPQGFEYATTSFVVPSNGVVTSFSMTTVSENAGQQLDFQVLRPEGGTMYMVVGHTGTVTLAGTGGTEMFNANIPTLAGDVLGIYDVTGVTNCISNGGFVEAGDGIPDPAVGETVTLFESGPFTRNESANLVVLPTSKDQCMKNGWKNYGTMFKNQGQCVSFVATGGKHG